jgi:hypothetical protein
MTPKAEIAALVARVKRYFAGTPGTAKYEFGREIVEALILEALSAANPVPVDAGGGSFAITDGDIEHGARQMRAVLDDGHDDETALYSAIESMGGRVVDDPKALNAAPAPSDEEHVIQTADRLARRMGGRFVRHDAEPTTEGEADHA